MLAMMMVAALSITSCGDDDNGGSNSSIVGVWKCTSTDYGELDKYLYDNLKVGDIATFNKDNTYTLRGNINEDGTYVINGNLLSGRSDGVTVTYSIISLTSTTLILKQEELGVVMSFSRQSNPSGGGSSQGGDQGGEVSGDNLKVTIDGSTQEYNFYYNKLGRWSTDNKDYNQMAIGIISLTSDLRFRYPKSMTSSSFSAGYSNFVKDATSIKIGVSGQKCTYVSGSATVVSNDGSEFKVRFSNFKLKWNTSREIIFDGIMRVEI